MHSKTFSNVTAAVLLILLLLLAGPTVAQVFPGDSWIKVAPADVGLDAAKLKDARRYALTGDGSGYITRHGKLVMSWGDLRKQYDLKSTSKSIGVTALALAIADGSIALDDRAIKHHPTLGTPPEGNAKTGWLDEITIRHLATQTAGFAKPGGYEELQFRPGTKWLYSDGGPNWLAECVTLVYGRDIEELLFERVFTPIGITRADLRWRNNAYRPREIEGVKRREFGSGVHANVDAMARIGLLYLRRGRWKDRQLIPAEFVDMARTTVKEVVDLPEHPEPDREGKEWSSRYGNVSAHYGLLWWNNADGTLSNVPKDAYWSWGLYDSLIVVIPSFDIVVSRAGKSWERDPKARHYEVLQPFLGPIVASVVDAARTPDGSAIRSTSDNAPYPPSRIITGIEWAPKESIIRLAKGSDNWPITWASDGNLYTAYGDGWGFEPRVEKKLSLGLARITGSPPNIAGHNIRSASAERVGQGKDGLKASGMLSVDGVLHMWVRNATNSQLGWSNDRGATWEWADWKFTTSFGCPTFLNFGRDDAGARDDFVYVYSQDSDSAYQPSDRFVLARVPKDRIRQRDAYEFLQHIKNGKPAWTRDIAQRGAVFDHPGRCYRSGISYNAGLRRYLWCQILPESEDPRGPRFEGGFGVYEAPEPWGPWSTVYFTEHWDVGPGETSSFPTKWMSGDGKTVHLLFSGDDCFSVRRATLRTNE